MVQLNTKRRITPKKEELNHSRGIPHLVQTDHLVARIRRDPADFDNVEGLAEDVMGVARRKIWPHRTFHTGLPRGGLMPVARRTLISHPGRRNSPGMACARHVLAQGFLSYPRACSRPRVHGSRTTLPELFDRYVWVTAHCTFGYWKVHLV